MRKPDTSSPAAPASDAGAPAARRPGARWGIALLGGLFVGIIVVQAAYEIWGSYRAAELATGREIDAQSRVIAEQTGRAIQALDIVLADLVERLQGGSLAHADADEVFRYLNERARWLVQGDGLAVFNADGSLRAVSQVEPARMPALNFSNNAPFQHMRDKAGGGLHIDHTVISPGTGRWTIPIGRRFTDARGDLAGVVAVAGRVEYFQRFYSDTYADPSTRISLAHRDGTLLARHPPTDEALGRPVRGLTGLLPASETGPATIRRFPSPIDGVDQFVALRLVPGYPLVVAVSRDAATALQPWRHQALATGARTLALGAAACGLLVLVLRQLQRLNAARASLETSEARYALAMTGSDEGHWLLDFGTQQVYVSARIAEMFGIAGGAQEMRDSEYFARLPLHPEDRERVHRNRNDHVTGITPRLNHEFRIITPGSNEVRWVHTRAQCFRDWAGRPVRMAGSTVDVTERKQAEQALRESEERYALAMAGSRGGHWVWDAATDRMFTSPAVRELFGAAPDAVPGTRAALQEVIRYHPDDRDEALRIGGDLAAGRRARADYAFRIVLPDGGIRWVLMRAQRFETAIGTRVAGVCVDITEQKQAEAERQRLEQQLRQAQKLEAIGTLAGGIAHDFNNILSAILGYGELVQREAGGGTPLRRHIDAAMSAGYRAKSLVERILAFSRSGTGTRVPVHVKSVLEEAVGAVGATLPAGVRLTHRVATGDAGLSGDPTQLHQVVLNLCANAVQAMKHEGELEVVADVGVLDAPLAVATSTLPPGRYIRLQVRDTGCGMAPHLLERIFDPFFTTREVGVGTGLGLSLVHGIVTDLGGGIAVQSREGEGSVFSIWLPASDDVAAPAPAPALVVAPGHGETILLVDDEEPLVRLGEEMLAELGYEPVGFASSRAALEAFRAEPDRFDLLLSDEAMPDMTGSELAAQVRRLRPELPIVLMSGFVNTALVQRAREHGVRQVLNKPLAERDIALGLAAALKEDAPVAAAP